MSDAVVAQSEVAIAQGSKSFAAAARLFDPATRDDAVMLYAWCRHCDDVIDGQHDLGGVEAELLGDFFDGIDGGAVDFGVAGFAEAAVGDGAAEAFEDGFEGGGAAVHGGGLDDFGDEPAAFGFGGHGVNGRRPGR